MSPHTEPNRERVHTPVFHGHPQPSPPFLAFSATTSNLHTYEAPKLEKLSPFRLFALLLCRSLWRRRRRWTWRPCCAAPRPGSAGRQRDATHLASPIASARGELLGRGASAVRFAGIGAAAASPPPSPMAPSIW